MIITEHDQLHIFLQTKCVFHLHSSLVLVVFRAMQKRLACSLFTVGEYMAFYFLASIVLKVFIYNITSCGLIKRFLYRSCLLLIHTQLSLQQFLHPFSDIQMAHISIADTCVSFLTCSYVLMGLYTNFLSSSVQSQLFQTTLHY